MSEQKSSHKVEGIVHRAPRLDCVEVQNISAALKVRKNTVASIILKRKKFGTTKTPSRAGYPAKLSNLGQGGDQEPMVTLTELQIPLWRWENLPEGQPSLQHSTNQAFMVEWPEGSPSSVKGT